MKIVNSIYQIYTSQADLYEVLKKTVDTTIESTIPKKWHYISRLKSIESFAIKLETGRVSDPKNIEDLLGCTIVVENSNEIHSAIKLLKQFFKIINQRPQITSKTTKHSDSFVFDDLRLYVKLKKSSATQSGPINDMLFEIQIKTFLQHAWTISTHDLIYKSNEICWIKQRVAFQVKAMLENAEVSIEKVKRIKQLPGLPLDNDITIRQKEVKQFLVKNWDESNLPHDLIRLIDNIINLLKIFFISLEHLQEILDVETNSGKGRSITNLTPYLILIQCLINQETKAFIKFLRSSSSKKILITKELDLSLVKDYISVSNTIILIPN